MSLSTNAAIVLEAGGDFVFREVELDSLRADELLIEIEACGICFTDVEAKNILEPPVVLGHEGAGVVASVGADVKNVSVGDRVIISYPSCGQCRACNVGAPYACDSNASLSFGGCRSDGSKPVNLEGEAISSAFFQQSSFANHAITNERNVVVLTSDHEPPLLAAIPCGIQTGAGSVMNTLGVKAGEGLVVYGAGTVGLSAIMAAAIVGASPLICVDVNARRLEFAMEFGATEVINASDSSPVERIKVLALHGVPYVLETSGSLQAFEAGIENLCMGGTLGYVTPPSHGDSVPFSFERAMMKASNLRGIIQGSSVAQEFLPRLLQLQRDGRFPFERLITTYAFDDINQAFADAKSGEVVKPVLLMGS